MNTDCSIYVAPRGDVFQTFIVQQVEWGIQNKLLCGYCIKDNGRTTSRHKKSQKSSSKTSIGHF